MEAKEIFILVAHIISIVGVIIGVIATLKWSDWFGF